MSSASCKISLVVYVLGFAVFFYFTWRDWPKHKIELGAEDMRLVQPVSTIWCEAVVLYSDHYFEAHHVSSSSQMKPLELTSEALSLGNQSFKEYKYFFLPYSAIEIMASSFSPNMKLLIFKGHTNVLDCLRSIRKYLQFPQFKGNFSKPMNYDSDEHDRDCSSEENIFPSEISDYKDVCSSLLHFQSISLTHDASSDCSLSTKVHPVKMNITSADYYVIVVWNNNPNLTNYANFTVTLDQTRYELERFGYPVHICKFTKICIMGLSFTSGDCVLLSIPKESNAANSTAVIHYYCNPHTTFFAFLCLCLTVFLLFVVRRAYTIFRKINRKYRNANNRIINNQKEVTPTSIDCDKSSHKSVSLTVVPSRLADQLDDMPAAYNTLYDLPPTCNYM